MSSRLLDEVVSNQWVNNVVFLYQRTSEGSEVSQVKKQADKETSSALFDVKEQALRVLLLALAFATRMRYLDVPKYIV